MKRYVCGTIFSLAMLVATNGSATTLMRMTDDELVANSKYIVAGHVQKIETRLERNNAPFQYITIKVLKVFKQDENSPLLQNEEFTIRQIGGEVLGVSLSIDGLPKFVENEDVVVCLEQDTYRGFYYVVGSAQGMYHVANNDLINDTTQDNTMFARKGENGEITFGKGEVRKTTINNLQNKIDNAINNEEAAR